MMDRCLYLLRHLLTTRRSIGLRKMEKGTIKRLTDKGFGFISTEDNGKDMFFHSSACQGVAYNDLHEGQTVTYTVGQGPKGPRAENVQLADD